MFFMNKVLDHRLLITPNKPPSATPKASQARSWSLAEWLTIIVGVLWESPKQHLEEFLHKQWSQTAEKFDYREHTNPE